MSNKTTYQKKDTWFYRRVQEEQRRILAEELRRHNFNILQTANFTGLSRNTIYKIMGRTKQDIQKSVARDSGRVIQVISRSN